METTNVIFRAVSKAIILSIALFLISCGSGDNKDSNEKSDEQALIDKSTWKTYEDSKYGFKLSYPSDWEFSTNEGNLYLVLKMPRKKGSLFQPNMNLIIEELPSDEITLEFYEKAGIEQLTNNPDMEAKIVTTGEVKINNNIPARYIISEVVQLGFKIKLKQTFFKHKNYMLIYTTATLSQNFDEEVKIFDEIINTTSIVS